MRYTIDVKENSDNIESNILRRHFLSKSKPCGRMFEQFVKQIFPIIVFVLKRTELSLTSEINVFTGDNNRKFVLLLNEISPCEQRPTYRTKTNIFEPSNENCYLQPVLIIKNKILMLAS